MKRRVVRITKFRLSEVSVVDRPANPYSTLDSWQIAKRLDAPFPEESKPAIRKFFQWLGFEKGDGPINKQPNGPDSEVGYADPGYRNDGIYRFPLKTDGLWDTQRIQAAWVLLRDNGETRDLYSPDELANMIARIKTAGQQAFDDPNWPPDADVPNNPPAPNPEMRILDGEGIEATGSDDQLAKLEQLLKYSPDQSRDDHGRFGEGGGGGNKETKPTSSRTRGPRAATYKEAMAAGQDAGNRSMKAGGRTEWNEDDWNAAQAVVQRLYGDGTNKLDGFSSITKSAVLEEEVSDDSKKGEGNMPTKQIEVTDDILKVIEDYKNGTGAFAKSSDPSANAAVVQGAHDALQAMGAPPHHDTEGGDDIDVPDSNSSGSDSGPPRTSASPPSSYWPDNLTHPYDKIDKAMKAILSAEQLDDTVKAEAATAARQLIRKAKMKFDPDDMEPMQKVHSALIKMGANCDLKQKSDAELQMTKMAREMRNLVKQNQELIAALREGKVAKAEEPKQAEVVNANAYPTNEEQMAEFLRKALGPFIEKTEALEKKFDALPQPLPQGLQLRAVGKDGSVSDLDGKKLVAGADPAQPIEKQMITDPHDLIKAVAKVHQEPGRNITSLYAQ